MRRLRRLRAGLPGGGDLLNEDDLPAQWSGYILDNAAFFEATLPGQDEPLGSPGGAARLGPLTVDAPLVAEQPPGPLS